MGYSPWGCKEWDTTERVHFHHVSLMCFGSPEKGVHGSVGETWESGWRSRWGRGCVGVQRLEHGCLVTQWLCMQGRRDEDGNLDGATSPAFMCTGEGLQVGAIKGYNPGEMHQACDLDHTGC